MENKKKFGCIVGRFQTPFLHRAHKALIDKALSENDKVIIVIGSSPVRVTDKNPLSSSVIGSMISQEYMIAIMSDKLEMKVLDDHKSDEVWSRNLDALLPDNTTLYGGRDSFSKYYSGKFPVLEIDEVEHISASSIREEIGKNYPMTQDQRIGAIWAAMHKFPTAYPCVDIVIENRKGQFLLARKKDHQHYCFVGGFVDPTDESFEHAAKRELSEEVLGFPDYKPEEFHYIASSKIQDWRYRGTKDGIISSLYRVYLKPKDEYLMSSFKAGDDIIEIQWFDIHTFDINTLAENHRVFFNKLYPFKK